MYYAVWSATDLIDGSNTVRLLSTVCVTIATKWHKFEKAVTSIDTILFGDMGVKYV